MDTEYLKDSYKSRLWAVVVFNVAVYWGVILSHADFSAVVALLGSLSIKDGLIGLFTPTVAFVLDGLLSADTKSRVIFWQYNHPLPGSRAFSVYLNKEDRADPVWLAQHWGPFPDEPVGQNRLWYHIYKTVEKEIRVHEAHRAWLFSRDLTSYAVLFLVLFGIAALFSDTPWIISWWYLAGLTVQYLVAMIAARTYGVRFVCQVLVTTSQTKREKFTVAH